MTGISERGLMAKGDKESDVVQLAERGWVKRLKEGEEVMKIDPFAGLCKYMGYGYGYG